jgi:hypothetical protein
MYHNNVTFCWPCIIMYHNNVTFCWPCIIMYHNNVSFCWPCIIMYHNNVTNLINFHFQSHFIVSWSSTCFGRQASIFRTHYTSSFWCELRAVVATGWLVVRRLQSSYNLQPAKSYSARNSHQKTASVVLPEDGSLTPETCRGSRRNKVIVKVKVCYVGYVIVIDGQGMKEQHY